jgi:hypothetical protein
MGQVVIPTREAAAVNSSSVTSHKALAANLLLDFTKL